MGALSLSQTRWLQCFPNALHGVDILLLHLHFSIHLSVGSKLGSAFMETFSVVSCTVFGQIVPLCGHNNEAIPNKASGDIPAIRMCPVQNTFGTHQVPVICALNKLKAKYICEKLMTLPEAY